MTPKSQPFSFLNNDWHPGSFWLSSKACVSDCLMNFIFLTNDYECSQHSFNVCVCVSCSVGSDSSWPHEMQSARLLCPWNSPGENTGVDKHSLLQGIFPTQDQTQVSYTAGRFFTVWVNEVLYFKHTVFYFKHKFVYFLKYK